MALENKASTNPEMIERAKKLAKPNPSALKKVKQKEGVFELAAADFKSYAEQFKRTPEKKKEMAEELQKWCEENPHLYKQLFKSKMYHGTLQEQAMQRLEQLWIRASTGDSIERAFFDMYKLGTIGTAKFAMSLAKHAIQKKNMTANDAPKDDNDLRYLPLNMKDPAKLDDDKAPIFKVNLKVVDEANKGTAKTPAHLELECTNLGELSPAEQAEWPTVRDAMLRDGSDFRQSLDKIADRGDFSVSKADNSDELKVSSQMDGRVANAPYVASLFTYKTARNNLNEVDGVEVAKPEDRPVADMSY